MKKETFNINFAALLAGFPNNKITQQTQDVYWLMLKDIPADWFDRGIKECLMKCTFFPSITELGRASVPIEIGGGRINAYNYVKEYEIPWNKTLEKHVLRIEGKERKQVTGTPQP
ncbi:MAG: hypothetical protein ACE5J1_03175 [Nitrospiria bacterium]